MSSIASDHALEENLDKYAEVIVKAGLNIQPGQRLIVPGAPIETAAFVRRVTAHAYRAGASYVDVLWTDPQLNLIRLQEAPRDSFNQFSDWRVSAHTESIDRGDALLAIHADDPDLLRGQDEELLARIRNLSAEKYKLTSERLAKNEISWLVISVPVPRWSAKVLPDVPADQREAAMWDVIFTMCRIKQADPVAGWQTHIADLAARSTYLNQKSYTALKYSAPGTDLTIGLPEGHIWTGGQSTNSRGKTFTANIPTEEVFTLPHRDRVNGVLRSTRPISMPGILVEDFSFTFENGVIVKATAKSGESDLQRLLDMDDGARRIGEVALVPNSSPISQSGLLFYNGLYDENAACHIALGAAYPFTLTDGETMTNDQFAAAGGNISNLHLDFMVGSGQLDIDGVRSDGTTEPVMRQGEWAFAAK